MPAGYSGASLVSKLGYKPSQAVWFDGMPESVRAEIGDSGIAEQVVGANADAVHLFVTARVDLTAKLTALRQAIGRDGFVWVSWPKKASKVPTDITEDTIRAIALPMGWVDVKVCAIDEIWSGLKLMIRKKLR